MIIICGCGGGEDGDTILSPQRVDFLVNPKDSGFYEVIKIGLLGIIISKKNLGIELFYVKIKEKN